MSARRRRGRGSKSRRRKAPAPRPPSPPPKPTLRARALSGLGVTLGFLRIDAPGDPDPATRGLGLFPLLTLWASTLLVIIAYADGASLQGKPWAQSLFWICVTAIVLPFAARLCGARASEDERIGLVIALTLAFYMVRVLHNPIGFTDHDEFLHWRSAIDILTTQRLFVPNPLLPVSPFYPGLELVTTALVNITGLSIFAAGAIVIGVAKVVLVGSFYLVFRRFSQSPRLASLGVLLMMASSNFVFFDGEFSYESLAQAFVAVVFLVALRIADVEGRAPRYAPMILLVAAAVAVTHHLTAYYGAGVLTLVASTSWVLDRQRRRALRLTAMACAAVAICAVWQYHIGNPTSGYLLPTLKEGMRDFLHVLWNGLGRTLFVSSTGEALPAWQQWVSLGAVAITGLGLATGFFRVFAGNDMPKEIPVARNAQAQSGRMWAFVFTALTAGYPACVAMRLSSGSWEIGNRLGSFLFFGVAYVMAASAHGLWLGPSPNRGRALAVGGAITATLVGGIVSGFAPLAMPGPYRVGADSRSIEPFGIEVARWTRRYLGEGHIFAADTTNRLLEAVYGRQRVLTSLYDRYDISPLFFGNDVGPEQMDLIKRLNIEFILTDLRLTRSRPFFGSYFEVEEDPPDRSKPISKEQLEKFDFIPGVDRVFDSGSVAIYDMRALNGK